MKIKEFKKNHMAIWTVIGCISILVFWILWRIDAPQDQSVEVSSLPGLKENVSVLHKTQPEESGAEKKVSSEISSVATPEIASNSLAFFGLNQFSNQTLSMLYADAEFNAESDGDLAWLASKIRTQCAFLSGIPEDQYVDGDMTMGLVFRECRNIEESALYENWQLIEFASRNGQIEATLAQPSFPPPGNVNQEFGEFESIQQWQRVVANRIKRIADAGNPEAMLKIAEIYAGKFYSHTDYELAERYLAQLFQTPGLTSYQESLGVALLKGIERSRP